MPEEPLFLLAALVVGATGAACFMMWRVAGRPCHKEAEGRQEPAIAKRIILIRHGESEGNVDKTLYGRLADHLVPLTEKGKSQARQAGDKIKQIVGDGPVIFFVSPYERTRGTFRELKAALDGNRILKVWHIWSIIACRCNIDFRCPCRSGRKLEYVNKTSATSKYDSCRIARMMSSGPLPNLQDSVPHEAVETKRNKYGKFFYRIPEGESGADVLDRVSSFFDTLFRSFKRRWFDPDATVIIVTHGLTLRLFLTRYFHWSVELFERTKNPSNAAFVIMERVIEDCEGSCHATYKLTQNSAREIGLTTTDVEADFAEEADRDILGRNDIHIPALALSPSKPIPRALEEQMDFPLTDRTSSRKSIRSSGTLLMELAVGRDVIRPRHIDVPASPQGSNAATTVGVCAPKGTDEFAQ